MKDRLVTWICKNFIKNKYIIGVDASNEEDFGCKVEGYIDKKGVKHITSIKYF